MILVDDLVDYTGITRLRNKVWCHMSTDNHTDAGLIELHALAATIGLRRAWFQDKPRFPHYDLTPSRRIAALQAGAIAVDKFEFVRRVRREVSV